MVVSSRKIIMVGGSTHTSCLVDMETVGLQFAARSAALGSDFSVRQSIAIEPCPHHWIC
jgi:hypothetical protein